MKVARAISIRQPFVELILQGKKKFKYRSTPTKDSSISILANQG